LGLEYTQSTWEDAFHEEYNFGDDRYGVNADYNGFNVKLGYRLTNQITMNLGYHKYDLKPVKETKFYENIIGYEDNYADIEMSGIVLGLDGDFDIADRFSLTGSIGYGINGNYRWTRLEMDSSLKIATATHNCDAAILTAKIRFNYAITDNLSASIGYRYTSYDVDFGSGDKSSITSTGATAGLTYKFGEVAEISKSESKQPKPTDVPLVLKNELHSTEYTLLVSHSGKVKVGDTIEISAEQAIAIKDALCGPYMAPSDGEIGIRPTAWCKLGKKEVIFNADVKHDNTGKITGAILTVTEVK
jgi:opacity protein-like surface antigen